MNPYALGIMVSTAVVFTGLVAYGLMDEHPWLLAVLAVLAVYGFTPRRWFD